MITFDGTLKVFVQSFDVNKAISSMDFMVESEAVEDADRFSYELAKLIDQAKLAKEDGLEISIVVNRRGE